jgi:TolA-binding protein
VTLYLRKGETDPAADVALEVLRQARPCLTPGFGGMVGALMERRGQVVDAISIYEEVAERFPEDDAGRRAAMRLPALRRRRVE